MLRNLLSLALLLGILIGDLNAGCPIVNVPLIERVQSSDIVVEAIVKNKESYFNSESNFIFTAYTLQVFKLFKGQLQQQEITLITEGGTVGLQRLDVSPGLEPSIGQMGVFFLNHNVSWPTPSYATNTFYSKAGPLGMVYYSENNPKAFDLLNQWGYVSTSFYPELTKYTGNYSTIQQVPQVSSGNRRNTPVISSFTPTSITAGTNSILTINGTGFGSTRGSGKVQFRNADDGGASFIDALPSDYISWSDTEIKLKVLRRAGTGAIRVQNSLSNTSTSSSNITVRWAHLNVQSAFTGQDNTYTISHKDNNSAGGISWTWDKLFFDSTRARSAFIRALENWRCNTLINWDTVGFIQNDTNLKDNKSMVFWDSKGWLPSSTLGVCYSWYNGCTAPGNSMQWYVSELDIVFKRAVNWQFGPQAPAGGRTDFESVALHELGHGHQLGHVINTANVMNFSIGPNTSKRLLQSNDTACGNYVMQNSTLSVCGFGPMSLITPGNCRFEPLSANFSVSETNPCLGDTVIYTSTSTGNILSWDWTFGNGAVPASISGPGPHKVFYGFGGNKTVSLTVSTTTTSDVKSVPATVTVKTLPRPSASFMASFDRGCSYKTSITAPISGTNYAWDFDGLGTSSGREASFSFPQGGTYKIKSTATNSCATVLDSQIVNLVCTDFTKNTDTSCLSQSILFQNQSETVLSIQWDFGTGANPSTAAGEGPHSVSFSSGGSKVVFATFQTSAGVQTVFDSVFIKNDTPNEADFSVENLGNQTILCTSLSSGSNLSYLWDFGDGETSTQTNPTYTYTSNPSGLQLKLTTSNACNDAVKSITLPDFTSIQSAEKVSFKLYPNPNNGNFVLESQSIGETWECTDLQGRSISSGKILDNKTQISLPKLSPGLYFFKIDKQVLKFEVK